MSDPVYSKRIERYARLVKRGDVLVVKDANGNEQRESVVRSVDILVHLADGPDYLVSADEDVEIVLDDLPSDLASQIEAMKSEL